MLSSSTLASVLRGRLRSVQDGSGSSGSSSSNRVVHGNDEGRIPAAVLLIIHFTDGNARIILCRRSERLRNHAGQIAFPGGIFKEEDGDLLGTAFRETREEIGVDIDRGSIVGSLDDVYTLTSNFVVRPFVAVVDSISNVSINKGEVADVIDARLVELLKSMEKDEAGHGHREAYRFTYDGYVIWGATARILKQLRDVLGDVLAQ
ncbi:MAG: CoA pyrophosphatase [Candidatus Nitrosocaldus sp.]|nr:CoA pyrophosphatase [Candidatus Nitrosocaldus sp.]